MYICILTHTCMGLIGIWYALTHVHSKRCPTKYHAPTLNSLTWLIGTCKRTHSYTWRDSFIFHGVSNSWVYTASVRTLWERAPSGRYVESQDALFLQVIVRKRALWIGAPSRKETCNLSLRLLSICTGIYTNRVYEPSVRTVWEGAPSGRYRVACGSSPPPYLERRLSLCVFQWLWLFLYADMTHSYVWHDSYLCDMTYDCRWAGWIVSVPCAVEQATYRRGLICVTWLIHKCDMTHSFVWHDSFICVTWLIHMCDMTVWTSDISTRSLPLFFCLVSLVHMCAITAIYMCGMTAWLHHSNTHI